jgi:hypothetical protein
MREKRYSATAKANSKHPYDWGRAMALAVSKLLRQAEEDGLATHRRNLYDEDLRLRISELADGIQITLSWSPLAAPAADTATTAPLAVERVTIA